VNSKPLRSLKYYRTHKSWLKWFFHLSIQNIDGVKSLFFLDVLLTYLCAWVGKTASLGLADSARSHHIFKYASETCDVATNSSCYRRAQTEEMKWLEPSWFTSAYIFVTVTILIFILWTVFNFLFHCINFTARELHRTSHVNNCQ
jgi:hypothetical protein